MNSFRLFLMNKHNSHTVLVCQHDDRFTSEAALLSVVFLVSMCSLGFGQLEAVLPKRLLRYVNMERDAVFHGVVQSS